MSKAVDRSFDVIVLGAGAWGSAATQHLASRKHRVLCVDRFTPPHGHGSTHGHSRVITTAVDPSSQNLALIFRSYALWQELEKASARRLLERIGYLYMGSPGSQRMARSLGSDVPSAAQLQVLSLIEIRRRFPQFRLIPGEIGIFDPQAGRLDPEACVAAALETAARHGAIFKFGEPAIGWRAVGSGIEVSTTDGRYRADWVVLALGAWTSQLSQVDLPLWAERQVTIWYAYLGDTLPGFSFPAEPPVSGFYGVPEADGRVKVAAHHGGGATDPDSVAPAVDADVDLVRRLLSERFPQLTDVLTSTTCLYPNASDYKFAIGPHPSDAHVLVLAGGSGRGFHQAQVIGEFVADYVDGQARSDFDSFGLDRFARANSL